MNMRRVTDSREAKLAEVKERENRLTLVYENHNGLIPKEKLTITDTGALTPRR